MPKSVLREDDLSDGSIDILALLVKTGLCPSKSEARRAVEQGGVEAAGEKVTSFGKKFSAEELSGEGVVIRRGKKKFCRAAIR